MEGHIVSSCAVGSATPTAKAPAIPLYTLSRADLVSKRVGNYIYNPEFGVLLDQLWVK